MAATGSAVGLANIWGFPTLAAQNGGAAFLLVYVLITFLVGFPLLMAEFTLGRYAKSNPVGTYQKVARRETIRSYRVYRDNYCKPYFEFLLYCSRKNAGPFSECIIGNPFF